ncbi:DUF6338 family protein [Clostridium lacusfryxellense]|uniref:DUF6338 family protein n=1 Tax=Clostridium lacusfryxellense TaxID=205328 RepID=UPI001C0DE2B7|nr:DUF6338 family protein [Clostridium lacusfryxellense]MBU3110296.1 hypothetical protein [Clostridium lacusfryxellense]
MEFKDIVTLIPQLLILFIPGYIALTISSNYRQDYKIDDKKLVVLSVLYSFIIDTSLRFIIFILKFIYFSIATWKSFSTISVYRDSIAINKSSLFYIIGMLVLGVMTSWILTRCSSFKISLWINKFLFKSNLLPCSVVWNKALECDDNWVKIYLKDENVLYYGKIDMFSSNPNDNRREVYLINYISYYLDTLDEIDNYSDTTNSKLNTTKVDNNKVGVWINTDTVKRIEIFRPPEKKVVP